MKLTKYQVDAFAGKRFEGNPAAVVPLAEWLPDELLQGIASENNLSETAYIVPEGKGFELRWFTPASEVALCGHATLATAHVLYGHMDYTEPYIRFKTRQSGVLTVSKEQGGYTMDFPRDTFNHVRIPAKLREAINIAPTEAFMGLTDYMLVFPNQEIIENLAPDFGLLKQVKARGVIATAPGNEHDFVSRFFGPQVGIDEDPVTGSAHTTLTPYWAEKLGKNKLSAKQISPRGGEVQCELKGDRVMLSGKAVTYSIGTIFI